MGEICSQDYYTASNLITVYAYYQFQMFDTVITGSSVLWRIHTVKGPAIIYPSPSLTFYFSISLILPSFLASIWWETDRAWSTATHCQVPANGINRIDG